MVDLLWSSMGIAHSTHTYGDYRREIRGVHQAIERRSRLCAVGMAEAKKTSRADTSGTMSEKLGREWSETLLVIAF